MGIFIGKTFAGGVIELDGSRFEECVFDQCMLRYAARAPVQLVNCRFISCSWNFEGAAGLTIDFLRALGQGGGVDVLAELLGDSVVTRERRIPTSAAIADAT